MGRLSKLLGLDDLCEHNKTEWNKQAVLRTGHIEARMPVEDGRARVKVEDIHVCNDCGQIIDWGESEFRWIELK